MFEEGPFAFTSELCLPALVLGMAGYASLLAGGADANEVRNHLLESLV
jgi:hypothetical protein